jgi:hypothetical protein
MYTIRPVAGIHLNPTVTSSMPEKGGFAIVEKYGD